MEPCHIQVGLKQAPQRRWGFLWLWVLVRSPGLKARLDRPLVAEGRKQGVGSDLGSKSAALYPFPNAPQLSPTQNLSKMLWSWLLDLSGLG